MCTSGGTRFLHLGLNFSTTLLGCSTEAAWGQGDGNRGWATAARAPCPGGTLPVAPPLCLSHTRTAFQVLFIPTKDGDAPGLFPMVCVSQLGRVGRLQGALLRENKGIRPGLRRGEQVGSSCSSSLSSCYRGPSPHKGSFVRMAKVQSRKGRRASPPSCFWRYNLPRLLQDLFSVELH